MPHYAVMRYFYNYVLSNG